MSWKKVEIPNWGHYYERTEAENMNEKDINQTIAIEKFGKGWDELAEFEQRAIYQVWNIKQRSKLEKYLW